MQNEISTKTLVPVFNKTGCCGHILRTLRLAMRMIDSPGAAGKLKSQGKKTERVGSPLRSRSA
jgi:hypothetical protein